MNHPHWWLLVGLGDDRRPISDRFASEQDASSELVEIDAPNDYESSNARPETACRGVFCISDGLLSGESLDAWQRLRVGFPETIPFALLSSGELSSGESGLKGDLSVFDRTLARQQWEAASGAEFVAMVCGTEVVDAGGEVESVASQPERTPQRASSIPLCEDVRQLLKARKFREFPETVRGPRSQWNSRVYNEHLTSVIAELLYREPPSRKFPRRMEERNADTVPAHIGHWLLAVQYTLFLSKYREPPDPDQGSEMERIPLQDVPVLRSRQSRLPGCELAAPKLIAIVLFVLHQWQSQRTIEAPDRVSVVKKELPRELKSHLPADHPDRTSADCKWMCLKIDGWSLNSDELNPEEYVIEDDRPERVTRDGLSESLDNFKKANSSCFLMDCSNGGAGETDDSSNTQSTHLWFKPHEQQSSANN